MKQLSLALFLTVSLAACGGLEPELDLDVTDDALRTNLATALARIEVISVYRLDPITYVSDGSITVFAVDPANGDVLEISADRMLNNVRDKTVAGAVERCHQSLDARGKVLFGAAGRCEAKTCGHLREALGATAIGTFDSVAAARDANLFSRFTTVVPAADCVVCALAIPQQ